MKTKHVLPVVALSMMAAGCNTVKESPLSAGIQLVNLDTTALPGTDFYEFACGGWMKNHPLTAEFSRYGSFDVLAETNQARLRGIIDSLAAGQHAEGTLQQKIGDLYRVAMDSTKRNADGAKPIMADLKRLAAIKSVSEIAPLVGEMQHQGLRPYFSFYVSADDKNSSMNIAHLNQGGLGLGQRDYYVEKDDRSQHIREQYQLMIKKIFALAGFSEAEASAAGKAVMNIETQLAYASRSNVQLRDPQANYNKQTLADLKKATPAFDWDAYLKALGIQNLVDLNVGQPEVIESMSEIVGKTPLKDQIAYLQWKLLSRSANLLSDDFVQTYFDFFGKVMSGRQELQPRWKRAVSAVDGALGEAVGQIYVEQYFPPAAKQRMIGLVKNLQTALGERIKALDWMSAETKTKALEKLATFHVKIGYPDKWRDYTALKIANDSYYENMKRATIFEYDYMLSQLGKPVDKEEWGMTPQTVNAYYNPSTNEICFPAGILQYPFFDMEADDAFNYGAIGVVIGHEMTHGFDDQGRQFDKDGNLKDWWTEEDAKKFNERAQVMVNFFDSIQVAPGVYGNGKLTLGENIADYGGLQVSYQAMKTATKAAPLGDKLGFTPDQRFFLAYAGVWAANVRPEEVLRRTKSDVHSLGRWRVNGALPQISAWYEAFHITEKDPMFVPVEKRVLIW